MHATNSKMLQSKILIYSRTKNVIEQVRLVDLSSNSTKNGRTIPFYLNKFSIKHAIM